jgi:hypothetical protein
MPQQFIVENPEEIVNAVPPMVAREFRVTRQPDGQIEILMQSQDPKYLPGIVISLNDKAARAFASMIVKAADRKAEGRFLRMRPADRNFGSN